MIDPIDNLISERVYRDSEALMSEKAAKVSPEAETSGLRPVGLTLSSIFFGIAGIYYLAYPLVQDPTIVPLYVLGAVSLIGSYGLMRMSRWGLWLGLLLSPAQIIAPLFTLLVTMRLLASTQTVDVIAFTASLVVLIFLASLAFLFVLDKRKSFK
jgi:hypothetical protein